MYFLFAFSAKNKKANRYVSNNRPCIYKRQQTELFAAFFIYGDDGQD